MARYFRALRIVVNGLALVSVLLTSLPLSQVAAAPVPTDSATAEGHVSDLDRSSAEPSFRHSSPGDLPPSASQMETDLAGWRFDLTLASLDRPVGWDRIASQAARRASTSRNEGVSQSRPFTPRALPVTFTSNRGTSLLSLDPAPESSEALSSAQTSSFSGLGEPGLSAEVQPPNRPQSAPAVAPSTRFVTRSDRDVASYVVAATDQGVYYTKNISATSPTWEALNDGFVTADDKNVYDLWRKPGNARFETLWATTASGIWRNVSPFSGGEWEKLSTGNPPDSWGDSPNSPTASALTYTAILGTKEAVYALAGWQNDADEWRG